jgi:hypothetical protein
LQACDVCKSVISIHHRVPTTLNITGKEEPLTGAPVRRYLFCTPACQMEFMEKHGYTKNTVINEGVGYYKNRKFTAKSVENTKVPEKPERPQTNYGKEDAKKKAKLDKVSKTAQTPSVMQFFKPSKVVKTTTIQIDTKGITSTTTEVTTRVTVATCNKCTKTVDPNKPDGCTCYADLQIEDEEVIVKKGRKSKRVVTSDDEDESPEKRRKENEDKEVEVLAEIDDTD